MAVHSELASIATLSLLLYRVDDRIPADDPYATMILSQASNTVRAAARRPGWVRLTDGTLPGPGQIEAPQDAQDITAHVAARAYSNPRNLERRTAGPVSETFRDNGVVGLGLTEDEKGRLALLGPTSGGFWVQPLDYGDVDEPVVVPSVTSYGVTDLGGTYLGMGSQWPWNIP